MALPGQRETWAFQDSFARRIASRGASLVGCDRRRFFQQRSHSIGTGSVLAILFVVSLFSGAFYRFHLPCKHFLVLG